MVDALMAISGWFWRKWLPIYPPITAPTTTTKFHFCALISNLKKEATFPAPPMAQRVLRLEDIPKFFPKIVRLSITKAKRGPDTYHGQGSRIKSISIVFYQK